MRTQLSKKRLPRVERSEDFHIEDDTTHLWAVSYADFLMVLLSFFVIFFSTSPEHKESIIRRIVASTDTKLTTAEIASDLEKSKDSPSSTNSPLSRLVLEKGVEIETIGDQLVLSLPDDLYQKGHLALQGASLSLYRELIRSLMIYKNQVELTIIGHTDSTPVKNIRGPFLDNNFAFSATRASEALKIAAEEGFPVEYLSAKGSADQKRNTRSLSLVLSNIEK